MTLAAEAGTTIEQVVPEGTVVNLAEVLDLLKRAPDLAPFSDEVIEFCSRFSRAIFKDTAALKFPELQALAFWMRKAELVRLRDSFEASKRPEALLVPQGLAFHIPPSNVDTIFVYSWLLSVLAGNKNVIRLSPKVSPQTDILCRLFNQTLETGPEAMRDSTVMLRYGHERKITEAISAVAAVRVIWGGDRSVRAIREIPLPPNARELTFPDRYSFAVIRASCYLALEKRRSPAERFHVAEQFYNDTFWFDQMACSSPHLVFWEGDEHDVRTASARFLADVGEHAERKQYEVQPATRMNRFTFACQEALEGRASTYEDLGVLTVLGVDRFDQLSRDHCGGGLIFQYRLRALAELVPFVARRDQTMTYFGFEPEELRAFAQKLNGRGVDRIVPLGQALNFNRFWDGNDLLLQFMRYVYIA
jgi:Acyl-CoA reductase (LuxC)